MATAKLIQIVYEEQHRKECYPFADTYFNQDLTLFFENTIISELVPLWRYETKLSICSWRLREKMKWNVGRNRALTEDLLESDYDVLSFTKNTAHHQMLSAADRHHPGFIETLRMICWKIGIELKREVKNPIYQNHFSARIEIYRDYVENYLNPAMKVMTEDKEIASRCMNDSKYAGLARRSADFLKEKFGINYYPMHPFLLERLFSVYCDHKRINVTTI